MTPNELMRAVRDRKAVIHRGHRLPAAFMVNWQFWRVMDMLPDIIAYNPRKKIPLA